MQHNLDKTDARGTAPLALVQPEATELPGLCGIEWIRRTTPPPLEGKAAGTSAVVDLFCGCGGPSLGVREALRARRCRMDVKLALDNNAEALAVYRANFRPADGAVLAKDVADVLPGNPGEPLSEKELALQQRLGNVDILVAGPPCQGHSDLNNATRRRDPRNVLYLKVVRFVEVAAPRIVIVENVPAVVHDRAGVVTASQVALKHLDYSVQDLVIDASSLGLPQTRKRHLLIATRGAMLGAINLPVNGRSVRVALSEFIGDIEDEWLTSDGMFRSPSRMTEANRLRVNYLFANHLYDLPDHLRPSCHRDKPHTYASMYGRLHWDRPAQTITSGFGSMGQGRFVDPRNPRMLTPHEAARIQGFPDFFDFSAAEHRTTLSQMIGNAVPPRIAAVVVDGLLALGAAVRRVPPCADPVGRRVPWKTSNSLRTR